MSDEPQARVEVVDGQVILHDPAALAVMKAVGRLNCRNTFELNKDRIRHFDGRIAEKGLTWKDAVIVVLNVDDINGGPIAEVLMPGMDWQAYRDRGEVPFARGLAGRQGIEDIIGLIDPEIAEKLKAITSVAAVVVDHGAVEVYDAWEWAET
jgi:hypothetical protein